MRPASDRHSMKCENEINFMNWIAILWTSYHKRTAYVMDELHTSFKNWWLPREHAPFSLTFPCLWMFQEDVHDIPGRYATYVSVTDRIMQSMLNMNNHNECAWDSRETVQENSPMFQGKKLVMAMKCEQLGDVTNYTGTIEETINDRCHTHA